MANNENLKPINSVDVAREMQKKSAEKRKQNTAERKLIKDRILERMGESDWDAFIDGIIERAKESTTGAEFFRDTIGEKPVERVEQLNIDAEYEQSVEYVRKLMENE
jgi:hypothetical protein